jgi:hypothetical protein
MMKIQKPKKSPSPIVSSDEDAPVDDRIIGRAFRWSLAVFVVVAVAVGGVLLVLRRGGPPTETRVTKLSAPQAAARAPAEAPRVRFTEVTAEAGIGFVHENGAVGEKLLPETLGGGAAFFDFDNDADEDLLFVNGRAWPWTKDSASRAATAVLYRNDGKGRFADVTGGSGLEESFYGMGVAVGDIDSDGWVDVFFTAVGTNHLYRNLGGGKFVNITPGAGVGGVGGQWSTACALFDLENDGDLDLFVGNYVQWSREIDFEVGYKIDGATRAYAQPMNFQGSFPYLYRNEGNGKFSDVSEAAGVRVENPATGRPMAKTLGVAPVDLNRDGWMDLVVANDTVQNFVFTNRHDGTFEEVGAVSGIAFDSYGNARGAMGIDSGQFRNDTSLGIAIGNFANEMTALYVSQDRGTLFADEAIPEGIGPSSRLLLKFGLLLFDYDLDGWLDLLTANGHLDEEIVKLQRSQTYRQPAQLFWNTGAAAAGFLTVGAERAGSDLFKPILGRGSACADIDGDGDMDVLLMQCGGGPLLLRNDQDLGHAWVQLKLVGRASNRDAIGAWVTVRAGGVTQSRQVMPTRSYLSQSTLVLTFGLGRATAIESAEVTWPGGRTESLPALRLRSLNRIEEQRSPEGTHGVRSR